MAVGRVNDFLNDLEPDVGSAFLSSTIALLSQQQCEFFVRILPTLSNK
jgi:hypothetical protein